MLPSLQLFGDEKTWFVLRLCHFKFEIKCYFDYIIIVKSTI